MPGHPWWSSCYEPTCQCREHGFDPWSRKIPYAEEQLSPCTTTTKPVCSRAHVLQVLSPPTATTEAQVLTACALQQENPLQ